MGDGGPGGSLHPSLLGGTIVVLSFSVPSYSSSLFSSPSPTGLVEIDRLTLSYVSKEWFINCY